MTDDSSDAPGWDAIDAALQAIHGDQEPRHWAPPVPAALGGGDPLDGISVYRSELGGKPHWHFVTYGYSELFAKESDEPELSGFGFEMTMRVIDPEATEEPPTWVIALLSNMARYVFRTGNAFAEGHHSTLNGPIALGRPTELVAVAFVRDPELPALDTPNGRLEFLQLVGLTEDEYKAVLAWDTVEFLKVLRSADPALTTDISRSSVLADPEVRRRVEEGTARDGSSMAVVFASRGSLSSEDGRKVLGVAANVLENLRVAVRGRLAHGRSFDLVWPEGSVTLAAQAEGDALVLAEADQRAIETIPEKRGDYPLPSGIVLRVLPVEIYDGTRTRVERVVG